MSWLPASLLISGSYLLGSVPFALLLGLARGVDIRRTGSGNTGATNLTRSLGRRWGIAAFVLDYAKGFVPVLSALALSPPDEDLHRILLALACGTASILGHVLPVWLRFRGGKGVATAFGVITGLAPIAALVAGAVWLALYRLTRVVSVSSLVAATAFPIGVAAEHIGTPWRGWIALEAFALLVTALIYFRHRANIRRILRGEELAFGKPPTADGPAEGEGEPEEATSERS